MSTTPTSGPTVLLTGASGVVGQALLERLAGCAVTCLVHRKPVDGPRLTTVRGDLTLPHFGLDRAAYDDLAARTDAVVHCAAITGFSADPGRTDALNVRGTENVLAFARRAGATVQHVSTAFVTRRDLTRDGYGSARPGVYLGSKRLAEQALADSGVPANIIRPSVVIGDSVTGRIARFQGLHAMAGALLGNALPMLPLEPDTRIDFVPQDLVADVVAGLLRAGTTGGEYWVTGGDAAPTAARMIELAVTVGRDAGLEPDVPRFVSPDMVERLIRPVFLAALPKARQRRIDDMLAMTALFRTTRPFTSAYDHVPGVRPLTAGQLEAAFTASVRHYARATGLVTAGEVAA